MDRYGDGYGQMREIFRHYGRISRSREDRRLADLEKRARSGKDPKALEEFNAAMRDRAEARGTTVQDELKRFQARNGDS